MGGQSFLARIPHFEYVLAWTPLHEKNHQRSCDRPVRGEVMSALEARAIAQRGRTHGVDGRLTWRRGSTSVS